VSQERTPIPRGGFGEWNDDSENGEDGGEDESGRVGNDGPADLTSENFGEARFLLEKSMPSHAEQGRHSP
jgi:hypothetical protein